MMNKLCKLLDHLVDAHGDSFNTSVEIAELWPETKARLVESLRVFDIENARGYDGGWGAMEPHANLLREFLR